VNYIWGMRLESATLSRPVPVTLGAESLVLWEPALSVATHLYGQAVFTHLYVVNIFLSLGHFIVLR